MPFRQKLVCWSNCPWLRKIKFEIISVFQCNHFTEVVPSSILIIDKKRVVIPFSINLVICMKTALLCAVWLKPEVDFPATFVRGEKREYFLSRRFSFHFSFLLLFFENEVSCSFPFKVRRHWKLLKKKNNWTSPHVNWIGRFFFFCAKNLMEVYVYFRFFNFRIFCSLLARWRELIFRIQCLEICH